MNERKQHLIGLHNTLCGKNSDDCIIAKSFKDVTCKSCMKSWEYKQYLAGKFREKPVKKSQTQGYIDIISEKK